MFRAQHAEIGVHCATFTATFVAVKAIDRREAKMASAIKLSDDLVQDAKTYGKAMKRSATGQIEYWARVGKLAEENPDLPFSFIRDTMIGLEEVKAGKLTDYRFE